MPFGDGLDQVEFRPEFSVERVGVVAHHVEATALAGAFEAESTDDHMPVRLDGPDNIPDVRGPLRRFGQEMENGPIMPDVIRLRGKSGAGDVLRQPNNAFRRLAKSFLCDVESGRRNIENRDVAVTFRGQVIH